MIDPIRFKRLLIKILKLLVIIELITAFVYGVTQNEWDRFGSDLIIAGILYIMWERITALLRRRKQEVRVKMEKAGQNIRLWDALIFSLLWTDEITREIPPDRLRHVVSAFTLIGIGLVLAFVKIGSGLMPLVISGALVLGGINLLIWLVSLEREGRESLQTELKLAHDVQVSLMPKDHPRLEGYDIAGMSLPAKEVGGDLFDFSDLRDDARLLGISVVDVSGKGMQAAMAAVFTSGALASEVRQTTSPAELLTRLNGAIYRHSRRGQFVAYMFGVLNGPERSLTFANAGQTKPLLRRGDSIRWLDGTGVHFPLGMQEDSSYQECSLHLLPGDLLLFLSDGITEAMDVAREVYGSERLEAVIRTTDGHDHSASDVLDRVVEDIRRHAGDAPQHDDMTLVVVRVLDAHS